MMNDKTSTQTAPSKPSASSKKNRLTLSFQARITLLIIIITVPLLVAVAAYISIRAGNSIEDMQKNKLADADQALVSSVTDWLKMNTQAAIELSQLPDIVSMNPARQKPIVVTMASAYPDLFLIHILNLNGIDIVRNDNAAPIDYHDRAWFQAAKSGTPVALEVVISRTINKPVLSIAVPIRDSSGQVVGVAGITSQLTKISNEVLSTTIGGSGYEYIVDNTNHVVAHPNPAFTATQLEDLSKYAPVAMLRQGSRHLVSFTDQNGQRWVANLEILDNGWGIISQEPESELLQPVQSFQSFSTIIIILGAVIIFIFSWLFMRRILRPIETLTETATAIAAGDLDQVAVVEGQDEISALANAFNVMTRQQRVLVSTLEDRVTERTQALEKRSSNLQTAAHIARDVSTLQNTEDLLKNVARLIRERFGYYHVGIFIIDENEEYAVLRAAGGEAGQLMLANKHRLKVGEVGLVGFVAQTGEARIALDVGADAVHFRNPLLPYTRSEMALPLKISNRVLGVLDIQSDKINAFDQNDITIMEILTDQVAVSIERTRLLQSLEQSTAQMEQSIQEYTARNWRTYLQQGRRQSGYRYEGVDIEPISEPSPENIDSSNLEAPSIIQSGKDKTGSLLAVPVRLRGQVLGILNLHFQSREVSSDVIKLVEQAADRLALALENARLVQDSQRLALRERQINMISAQVQQSTDLEAVLQNTIRELGNTLNVPNTFIQIGLFSADGESKTKE